MGQHDRIPSVLVFDSYLSDNLKRMIGWDVWDHKLPSVLVLAQDGRTPPLRTQSISLSK